MNHPVVYTTLRKVVVPTAQRVKCMCHFESSCIVLCCPVSSRINLSLSSVLSCVGPLLECWRFVSTQRVSTIDSVVVGEEVEKEERNERKTNRRERTLSSSIGFAFPASLLILRAIAPLFLSTANVMCSWT